MLDAKFMPGMDAMQFLRTIICILVECQFGKQAKELGSTWFADLGPPFGVMYCIKCECISVQKKRRVVAKVHCRNIKSECPEPSCDTPTLLPGRCCKTCPGDINSKFLLYGVSGDNESLLDEHTTESNVVHGVGRSTSTTSPTARLPLASSEWDISRALQ
ncbi:unnamed protein product [Euphydryas editha]|uniref:VWFC domain-containing protein n=1 Tax=Euphydryas editha TaxID=104508 RepID=A0AAU9UE57_EUPED|nr:unnamed protein product [Euphydryas editha]